MNLRFQFSSRSSSKVQQKLPPPNRFSIDEPGTGSLSELLWRHRMLRVQVTGRHQEDVACCQTCPSKGAGGHVVRHLLRCDAVDWLLKAADMKLLSSVG